VPGFHIGNKNIFGHQTLRCNSRINKRSSYSTIVQHI